MQRGTTATGLVSILTTLSANDLQHLLIDSVLPLTLPALPSVTHLTIAVVGAASNGTNEPVPNAAIQLLTNLTQNTAGTTIVQHEVDTQTDANGQVSVNLYSNDAGARMYTVNVSPTADSQFQSFATTVTVGTASGVSSNIQLVPRPQVTGRVIDPSGAPVMGAVLQPQLASLAAGYGSSLATTANIPTSTSDSNGRFALYLDAGSYQLGVIPPATAGLARLWLPSQTIGQDANLGDLTAPTAVMFDGGITDSTGAPVEATLRLYSVPASN